ncbi:IBP-8 protein [Fragilariopsis cylindrus CCMP1102]|uniref:IBP-8 protein n=1 Tax=Fragilariopsis cylindrus CCMP1102 TaxID=635003 RepID=A0A1E7EKI3_9STRA|nr:IBP-8 protein [Fragilariopsis cylindrus CCMP1102]|eukprot:OEU06396.1 IBP-8 protein [Fragilariopsis cylindrus CCMP1102]
MQSTAIYITGVDVGTAGDFAILTKTGVTTTGTTSVNGDMGTSPIAQAALTGFALILDASNTYATSDLVKGTSKVYAADHAAPTPTKMTTAIYDMETAYNNAAGRAGSKIVGMGAGDISGRTLDSGIYKWSSDVHFTGGLTFEGGPNEVWIMQIAGKFTAGPGAKIALAGGAKATNIFWAVAGAVAFDDGSHGEGMFLAKTMISFNAGSSLNGAALAQTAVTMIATSINELVENN